MVLPDGPNQRWNVDFIPDSLVRGRRSRILFVVDDFSRESLALVAGTSLFTSPAHARFVLAAWWHAYHTVRRHSKPSGKTLVEIAGERVWGPAPRHVAITSNNNHERVRLYL